MARTAAALLLCATTLTGGCAAPLAPPGSGASAPDASAILDASHLDAAPACDPARDRCPLGRYCVVAGGVASCQPGCKSDDECRGAASGTPTSRCCAHLCDETSLSRSNCGACGAPVPASQDCCDGVATDLASDPDHCGDCATACHLPNATPTCALGGCAVLSCLPGWGNCDGQPANGCESDLTSDRNHCGTCDNGCLILCFDSACFP